jgi:hypothetical protein
LPLHLSFNPHLGPGLQRAVKGGSTLTRGLSDCSSHVNRPRTTRGIISLQSEIMIYIKNNTVLYSTSCIIIQLMNGTECLSERRFRCSRARPFFSPSPRKGLDKPSKSSTVCFTHQLHIGMQRRSRPPNIDEKTIRGHVASKRLDGTRNEIALARNDNS